MSDRLLEAQEIAELLAVPVSWVRAETRAGRIPHLELGRYKRYDRNAVLAWLETQRAGQWRKHRPGRVA
ncbi:MAG TPA: helix-turn-helix domain-containing protein [Gaiellaceae bacterium]|nr:helix-turn-helix domain-containing protein [Gaiellaceae bacterium]